MTINNNNITMSIYVIMEAYKEVSENWGFDLLIMDHVPEGSRIAGKTGESEPKKFEDLPPSVQKRLRAKGITAGIFSSMLAGACIPREQFPEDWEEKDRIVIFYETLLLLAKDEDEVKSLAKEFVAHELRHAEQFTYLRRKGYSVLKAFENECNTEYGKGPLESDAWAYQKGRRVPIEEAMACFFN